MKVQFPVNTVLDRLVLSCSVHILIYLGLRHLAMGHTSGLFWYQCATSAGALIPFHFWLVNVAIASDLRDLSGVRRRSAWVRLLFASALAVLPFTALFIPEGAGPRFGPGFYIYIVGLLAMYLAVGLDAFRQSNSLSGGRRLAMRIWMWAGCVTFALVLLVTVLRATTHSAALSQTLPFIVLACFAWTTFALTAHRTFKPSQFRLVGVEKAILVAVLGTGAFLLHKLLHAWFSPTVALAATAALALCSSVVVKAWWDRKFRLYPQEAEARFGPAS
ncbi:hypothetical protein [Horticoccus sp. 23ND18S-11]|uniref:hypothetical protein n=1 Tax=Horticoccus sp. 23ND18S-11 TaxID=3391832 RepID=UPI0039C979D9